MSKTKAAVKKKDGLEKLGFNVHMTVLDRVLSTMTKEVDVNRQDHYNRFKIQPIQAIECWDLSFNLGQVVKYVARAGIKSESLRTDLRKALFYLKRELELLECRESGKAPRHPSKMGA